MSTVSEKMILSREIFLPLSSTYYIYIFSWVAAPSKILSNMSKMLNWKYTPKHDWGIWILLPLPYLLLAICMKFKVSDVMSCCQWARLPHAVTDVSVWVRFPCFHLCWPGGSTTSRLTHVTNHFGCCGPYLRPVQIRKRDAVSVSSTGIVPVHWQGDCGGLPITSDTSVHAFRSA